MASQPQLGASSFRVKVPTTSSATWGPGNDPEQATLPPSETDVLPGLEDTVRARIADHLRGAPAVYLPGTDEDCDQDYPPQMATR